MKRMIIIICGLAALAAVTALGLYAYKFGVGFASKISDWGAVGDFFGGVLNPTFALLSLILIAYTLMQNKKALDQGALALEQSEKAIQQGTRAIEQNEEALRVSNKELALTRDELANSAKALEEQAKLIAVQSFETTFFNMLGLLSKIRDSITYNPKRHADLATSLQKDKYFTDNTVGKNTDYRSIHAFTVIIKAISFLGIQRKRDSAFDIVLESQDRFFSNYFRTLHQILFQIDSTEYDKEVKEKYINILKSQLSNQELALLLLYCIHEEDKKEHFKKLVIRYEMLTDLTMEKSGPSHLLIKNPNLLISFDDFALPYLILENKKIVESAFGERITI